MRVGLQGGCASGGRALGCRRRCIGLQGDVHQRDMRWAAGGRALGFATLSSIRLSPSRLLVAMGQRPCPQEDSKPHGLVFSPQVMNPLPEGWEELRNQPSFGLCSEQPHVPQHPVSEMGTGMPGRGHLC